MANMTDEARTSMQAAQPATGTATESATTDTAENNEQGLLARLANAAKSAVSTVAETTQAAVSAVTERVAGDDTTTTTSQTDDEAPSLVERVGDVAQATVAQVQNVGARVYDRITGDNSDATATSTPTAQGLVTAQVDDTAAATVAADDVVTGDAQATATDETPASTGEAVEEGGEGASFEPTDASKRGGKPRRFKDVQPGMQFEGRVTSIALYGIFVDVGVGRDGLVHISEMSDTRVESPTDLVQIGDPVSVWVKSVDPEAWRISLTMRDPNRAKPPRERRPRKPQVDRDKLAGLKAGDMVDGTVSSIAPFGVFVDIGVGKDGLVHISELSEDRVEKAEDAVQVGGQYTFRILEVDPDGKRISLSLRRAQRVQRLQQLEPGTVLDGTVSGMAPFGAFVDIGVGRDGLVHISELSGDRVGSVEDVVKVGDKVQVKVIDVDQNSKRISLTMRVDEPPPAERPQPDRMSRQFEGAGEGTGERFSRSSVGSNQGRGGGASTETVERQIDYSKFERRPPQGAGGRGKPSRPRRDAPRDEPAQYTSQDPADEETFTGDATLEDLMSKFNAGKGRRAGGRRDERDETESEGEGEDGGGNRRNVITRTLAMRDDE